MRRNTSRACAQMSVSVCMWTITLASLFASGCSSAPESKPPKAVKTIAFITNTSSDFWRVVRKGCEQADKELEKVVVSFKIPFGTTSIEQERMIHESLNREDADAIAISPIDPAGQKKAIDNAAKRALLITHDSDAPDTDRALYLGADNVAAGRQAGELIKQALPQGGRIMVFVGKKDIQNAKERFEGLQAALQGSQVEIIGLLTDDNDQVRAKDNAAETIKKHPDVAGMVGLWSYNGPTILRAVSDAKMTGKIKIVCFDDEKATLDGIKEGSIFATVAQQPYEYGYQAIHLIAKILDGDRSAIPENKQVLIPTTVVDKKNVDQYRTKLNELLANQ